MTRVVSIGTYLPPWKMGKPGSAGGKGDRRVKGSDEDALTMAVAAGRAADPDASAQRVVLVSRNFPLVEGGNGAVLRRGGRWQLLAFRNTTPEGEWIGEITDPMPVSWVDGRLAIGERRGDVVDRCVTESIGTVVW